MRRLFERLFVAALPHVPLLLRLVAQCLKGGLNAALLPKHSVLLPDDTLTGMPSRSIWKQGLLDKAAAKEEQQRGRH